MDKFKNKYRIQSARAQWWNYGWDAAYFLTINTKDRQQYFGKIVEGKMSLSHAGKIADLCWREIPDHAMNIETGVYVVMPNHVHGILILNGNDERTINRKSIGQSRFQNPGKNTISSIVGGFKSAVSKLTGRSGIDFEWQSRFYDHIIRDEGEYWRISKYIVNNPGNWKGR